MSARLSARYALQRPLGQGGTAEIWEATDLISGERVAVKWFVAEQQARWRAELLALERIAAPGVVRLRASGMDEGRPWLVLDHVEGAPFPGLPTPCPWVALAPRLAALLQALSRLHGQGGTHGDLKPANVLVDGAGVLTLIDLGLARVLGVSSEMDEAEIAGTPGWMAPEILAGQPRSPRSDLYAVGAMAWAALTGAPPWDPGDGAALLALHTMANSPLPALEAPGSPPPTGVEALIRALLSLAPANRPSSAMEALDLLERAPGLPEVGALDWPTEPIADASAYERLFHGPERVLHLPSDAALALHTRAAGDLGEAKRELRRWVWSGLARVEGPRLRLERAALAELRAADRRLVAPSAPPLPRGLSRGLQGLLAWIALAGPDATPERLGALLRLHPDQVRQQLALLAEREQIHWNGVDPPEDRTGGAALAGWAPVRLGAAHASLADELPPGHPRRLRHLLAADDLWGAAEEARTLASRRRAEGRVEETLALLLRAVSWLVAEGERRLPEDLLEATLEAALDTNQIGPLEQVGALLRDQPQARHLLALARLARAAILGDQADFTATLAEIPARYDAPYLELWRASTLVRMAAGGPLSAHSLLLDALESDWAGDDPLRRTRMLIWRGGLAYRLGHYDEAATLYAQAAERRTRPNQAVAYLLAAASAWLEAGHLDEAGPLAARAEGLAAQHRLIHHEARAVWIRRACAWRTGAAVGVDEELLEVASALGRADLAGVLLLTEAGAAWSSADPRAPELALRAKTAFEAVSLGPGALLAGALWASLVGDRAEAGVLATRASTCTLPAIAVQALGLLAPLLEEPASWVDLAGSLAGERAEDGRRLELLSLREALDRLRRR